jgi:hypothetical protein
MHCIKASYGMKLFLYVAFGLFAMLLVASRAKAGEDALHEVNAQRAARGLAPYIADPALTQAAIAAADFRAANQIRGHTSNDLAFLPAGSIDVPAIGCGALETLWGWGSCCTFDNYTHAGAAFTLGKDGRRYMHLYVSHGGGSRTTVRTNTVTQSSSCTNGQCEVQTTRTRTLFRSRRR